MSKIGATDRHLSVQWCRWIFTWRRTHLETLLLSAVAGVVKFVSEVFLCGPEVGGSTNAGTT